jgi:hypothetical protein
VLLGSDSGIVQSGFCEVAITLSANEYTALRPHRTLKIPESAAK